jgi:hypothetical protein
MRNSSDRRHFIVSSILPTFSLVAGCASYAEDGNPTLPMVEADYATQEFRWVRDDKARVDVPESIRITGRVGRMRVYNEYTVSSGRYVAVARSWHGTYFSGRKNCLEMKSLGMTEARTGGIFIATNNGHPSALWIYAPMVVMANRVGLSWWVGISDELATRLRDAVVS